MNCDTCKMKMIWQPSENTYWCPRCKINKAPKPIFKDPDFKAPFELKKLKP